MITHDGSPKAVATAMEERPQLLELTVCFCIGTITTERLSPKV